MPPMPGPVTDSAAPQGGGIVLLTLASAQFLMTLDSSVMNVSIATVAKDVGTTVTGIQLAITLYTLVMAAFMITGGKIGQLFGRKRAFAIGCVIYGCGSFITGLAGSLPVLIIGWSVLEGLGAALIMPAVVALVATNFGAAERPRAYGLVASAGAIAVAVGPLVADSARPTSHGGWSSSARLSSWCASSPCPGAWPTQPANPTCTSIRSARSCPPPASRCSSTASSDRDRGEWCNQNPAHRSGSGCPPSSGCCSAVQACWPCSWSGRDDVSAGTGRPLFDPRLLRGPGCKRA